LLHDSLVGLRKKGFVEIVSLELIIVSDFGIRLFFVSKRPLEELRKEN